MAQPDTTAFVPDTVADSKFPKGFDYGKPKPEITDEVRLELSEKYIQLFERITGKTFELPPAGDVQKRLERSLQSYRA